MKPMGFGNKPIARKTVKEAVLTRYDPLETL
jgi:hypothetical protein